MTPTEQDKELRELLYTLLKTDPRADTYVIPYRVMDIFVEFITADRKRVALEARLDELEHCCGKCGVWHSETCNISQRRLTFRGRIAELKAQQEEVE